MEENQKLDQKLKETITERNDLAIKSYEDYLAKKKIVSLAIFSYR